MNQPRTKAGRQEKTDADIGSANFKLLLQYDGTDYCGWQIQRKEPTVQGALEEALKRIIGSGIRVSGASRTDAGVHALGQVANFKAQTRMKPEALQEALNCNLPHDIRVISVEQVDFDFHSRFTPSRKEYLYRIFTGRVVPPFLRRYVLHVRRPLSLDAMKAAAALFSGSMDLKAFENTGGSAKSTVRFIFESTLETCGEEIHYRIAANGFLKQMVRTVVGTLIEVGRGKMSAADVERVIASKDRTQAGPSVKAKGLFLKKVTYL
jgi:tRNA pseudouridine38-40 synthase